MSLKHRGGSKYSKKQMLYAKYDDQVGSHNSRKTESQRIALYCFLIVINV